MSTKNIKAKAIKVTIGTKVAFPLDGGVIYTLISVPDTPKTYNMNGGRITFVDENGDTFAIPALKDVAETLLSLTAMKKSKFLTDKEKAGIASFFPFLYINLFIFLLFFYFFYYILCCYTKIFH